MHLGKGVGGKSQTHENRVRTLPTVLLIFEIFGKGDYSPFKTIKGVRGYLGIPKTLLGPPRGL